MDEKQLPPDERESFETWNQFHEGRMWEQARKQLRAQGDDPEQLLRLVADAAARAPAVSALEALAANARLVGLLSGRRWYVMQAAREEGAEWAEVGAALGVSKQAAWEFYKRKIEEQETHAADYHDAE
jgi:hypothetical protein